MIHWLSSYNHKRTLTAPTSSSIFEHKQFSQPIRTLGVASSYWNNSAWVPVRTNTIVPGLVPSSTL